MPKKPPKGPFFYFMLEYKRQQERQGRRFPGGLQQISEECSPYWTKKTAQEKAKYGEKAKQDRLNSNGGLEKLSSQGVPLTFIENETKSKLIAVRTMKRTVDQIINEAILGETLNTQIFSFISFNYFCKVSENTYVPAEVALVNFNFENGIIDHYHTLINPGTLPMGMAFTARRHSDESHKLPLPPSAKGQVLFSTVFDQIHNFIFDDESQELRPVFTNISHIDVAESILNLLSSEADKDNDLFRVYPVHELFHNLKDASAKTGENVAGGFPSVHIAKAALERDTYEYHPNIGCETHEELDASNFCSLSIVKRWAFTFADNCCPDLGINLIPGCHLPIDSKIPINKFEDDISCFDDNQSGFSTYTSSYQPSESTYRDYNPESDYSLQTKIKSEFSNIDSDNDDSNSEFKLHTKRKNTPTSENRWKRHVPKTDSELSASTSHDFYSVLNKK